MSDRSLTSTTASVSDPPNQLRLTLELIARIFIIKSSVAVASEGKGFREEKMGIGERLEDRRARQGYREGGKGRDHRKRVAAVQADSLARHARASSTLFTRKLISTARLVDAA